MIEEQPKQPLSGAAQIAAERERQITGEGRDGGCAHRWEIDRLDRERQALQLP
jgi:hypothetical protein